MCDNYGKLLIIIYHSDNEIIAHNYPDTVRGAILLGSLQRRQNRERGELEYNS